MEEDVQRTGLVGGVLEDDIALLVLVFTEGDEDDVAVVDPDLFPELATDKTETLDTVEALDTGMSLVGRTGRQGGDCYLPWPPVCHSPASSGPERTPGHLL